MSYSCLTASCDLAMDLKKLTLISINDYVNVFLNSFGFYSIALSSIKVTAAAKEGKKSHILFFKLQRER